MIETTVRESERLFFTRALASTLLSLFRRRQRVKTYLHGEAHGGMEVVWLVTVERLSKKRERGEGPTKKKKKKAN